MGAIIGFVVIFCLASLALAAVSLVALWRLYQKMGHHGWEAIIPIYNYYILFEELYNDGKSFWKMLIPIYNIYIGVKLYIDWAAAFGKDTGFAIGMMFLPFIFCFKLLDDDVQYKGGSGVNNDEDIVTETVGKIKEYAEQSKVNNQNREAAKQLHDSSVNILEQIEKLGNLKSQGILTEEEFTNQKALLLEKLSYNNRNEADNGSAAEANVKNNQNAAVSSANVAVDNCNKQNQADEVQKIAEIPKEDNVEMVETVETADKPQKIENAERIEKIENIKKSEKIESISEEETEQEFIFCPQCGQKNNGAAKFCENCGSSII